MTLVCPLRFAFKSELNLSAEVLALWAMKNNISGNGKGTLTQI